MICLASEPKLVVKVFWEKAKIYQVILVPRQEGFFLDSEQDSSYLREWITLFSQKKPPSSSFLPLEDSLLSSFQKKVSEELQKIPFGKTLTYKEVAIAIGKKQACQAVGNACHRNLFPLLLPCHRVVASKGEGGYAYGKVLKGDLLSFERTPL